LRVPKVFSSSVESNYDDPVNEWPDESSFKIERWQRERSQKLPINESQTYEENYPCFQMPKQNLPRSNPRDLKETKHI